MPRQQDNCDIDEMVENKIRIDNEITEETLEILKGKIFQIVTCQNGSRILQTYIFKSTVDVIKKIFTELADHIPEIITNVYGNYFCQKFFLTLEDSDKVIFLKKVYNKIFYFFNVQISDNVLEISKSKIGTYPFQAIIENITGEEEKKVLFEGLKSKIFEMSLVNKI